MNTINFNQSVGFPLETEILDEMQKAWTILNALGAIAGNFTIISGCEVVATTAANGVVFINGEVLEFRGGVVQANVIIVETKQLREFEDGNSRDVIYTRYATFGIATTQWPWLNFKRGFETKEIPAALAAKEDKSSIAALVARVAALEAVSTVNVPSGLIAIWGQAANLIPTGWTEYTPLRGRMAVGFDSGVAEFDVLGDFGGAVNKTLSIDELPEHDHDTLVPIDGGGNQDLSTLIVSPNSDERYVAGPKTEKTGGDQSFSIMNPYRVVLYIIKT